MKRSFLRRSVLLLLPIMLLLCSCGSGDSAQVTYQGTTTASLSAVGDIYLTDDMLRFSKGINGQYDFTSLFSQITTQTAKADLTIGNLEGTFSNTSTGSYPDALATALGQAGFDILQTANSYSVYQGLSGLIRTKDIIEGQGIHALGTFRTEKEAKNENVLIKEVNGIRLAFIAFTKGFSGMGLPANSEYAVNLLYEDYATDYEDIDREGILALVETAVAQKPDFIIASLHWGSENISGVSSSQESITKLLLNAGVDVILGSHSHRLEQVERITVTKDNQPDRECIVAYGLGDFCSTTAGKHNTSIILNLEFTKDHKTGEHSISSVSYVPVSTVDNGAESSRRFSVVSSEDAIHLYENNYYLHISEDAYTAILKDLEDLNETIFPTATEEAE